MEAGTGSGADAESVTLADVKVGDRVVGPGVLKNGVFVPTELGVIDAATMGQRRRRATEAETGAGAASTGSGTGSVTAPK